MAYSKSSGKKRDRHSASECCRPKSCRWGQAAEGRPERSSLAQPSTCQKRMQPGRCQPQGQESLLGTECLQALGNSARKGQDQAPSTEGGCLALRMKVRQ